MGRPIAVRKDIGLVRAQARQRGLELPGVDAADGTLAAGFGELDATAILEVLGR